MKIRDFSSYFFSCSERFLTKTNKSLQNLAFSCKFFQVFKQNLVISCKIKQKLAKVKENLIVFASFCLKYFSFV